MIDGGQWRWCAADDNRRGSPAPIPSEGRTQQSTTQHYAALTKKKNSCRTSQGADGKPVYSWDQASTLLQQEYASTSLMARIPQAMWRGPPPLPAHPERSQLRQVFTQCGRAMLAEERPRDAALFNVQHTPVALQDACDFRCARGRWGRGEWGGRGGGKQGELALLARGECV